MTNTDDDIGLFSLRALAEYVIAHGIHKVELGPNASTHKYVAHWTGSEWEDYGQPNAFVFDYEKYAKEYLEENRQLLLDELRGWPR